MNEKAKITQKRLSDAVDRTASLAAAAKRQVRSAKTALKDARKAAKSAKKAAKDARKKMAAARLVSGDETSRKDTAGTSAKSVAVPRTVRSPSSTPAVKRRASGKSSKSHGSAAEVAKTVIGRMAAAQRSSSGPRRQRMIDAAPMREAEAGRRDTGEVVDDPDASANSGANAGDVVETNRE